MKFPYPIADLHCAECKPARDGSAISITLYNRSFLRVASGVGKRTYIVDVEIESMDREFDSTALAYVVRGVFKIRCPKCRKEHPETRELVRLPLRLLLEVATCERCWKPCRILESSTRFERRDDDVDLISVTGIIRCQRCEVERDIARTEQMAPRELAMSYGVRARADRLGEQSLKRNADIRIFFSYSHSDEQLRDELEKHLSQMKNDGTITAWHDRKITAGREWRGAIDEHLETADVILLLISADFLASSYCYDVELGRAMERHERGEACVIPVLLRPVDWHGAPFGELQSLPTDAKPVALWTSQDEALTNVAKGIRAAIADRKRRQPDIGDSTNPR